MRGTPSLVEAWDAIADIGADVMHLITRQDRSRIRTTGYYQINVSPTYATSWTGAFYAGFDPGPSEYLMNCPLNPKTGERLASEVLVTFIAIDTFLEVRARPQ